MDWFLFIPAIAGASFTIYISKDEAIPEFRGILDTSRDIVESDYLIKNRDKTRKEIDQTEAELEKLSREPSPNLKRIEALKQTLKAYEGELKRESKDLKEVEHRIRRDAFWRKVVGILFYIVLGGFFGAFLPDLAKIEGSSTEIPKMLASLLIGAGWTGYTSAIGLKGVPKKQEESVQNLENTTNKTLANLKAQLDKIIANTGTAAKTSGNTLITPNPEELKSLFTDASKEIEGDFKSIKIQMKRDWKACI